MTTTFAEGEVLTVEPVAGTQLRVQPERFVAAGDKVVVVAHVNVRLKDRTDWLEGRTGDVFTFRNGKVIEFRTDLPKTPVGKILRRELRDKK